MPSTLGGSVSRWPSSTFLRPRYANMKGCFACDTTEQLSNRSPRQESQACCSRSREKHPDVMTETCADSCAGSVAGCPFLLNLTALLFPKVSIASNFRYICTSRHIHTQLHQYIVHPIFFATCKHSYYFAVFKRFQTLRFDSSSLSYFKHHVAA